MGSGQTSDPSWLGLGSRSADIRETEGPRPCCDPAPSKPWPCLHTFSNCCTLRILISHAQPSACIEAAACSSTFHLRAFSEIESSTGPRYGSPAARNGPANKSIIGLGTKHQPGRDSSRKQTALIWSGLVWSAPVHRPASLVALHDNESSPCNNEIWSPDAAYVTPAPQIASRLGPTGSKGHLQMPSRANP